jgi:hypothetical protein
MRNLGVPDPDLRNSPVLEPVELEDRPSADDNTTLPVCYFNGESFEPGSYVRSGDMVLRCEGGVWAALPRDDDDYQ